MNINNAIEHSKAPRERDGETEIQTDRQTETGTDRDRER